MSRHAAPFVILDHDFSSADGAHLLGRLVTDVCRPLDSYLPPRALPLPFLSTYLLEAKLEPNTSINLSVLKSTNTVTRLTALLGLRISGEADSKTSFTLSSKLCRTVALEQHELVFAELMQRYKVEIHMALRRSEGTLYLVVGMKTALEPQIIREDERRRGVMVGAKAEVTVNGAGPTSVEVGTTLQKSYKSVLESGVDGERVFALQYCPVRFERKVRLARDGEGGGFMGVRGVKRARLDGRRGRTALGGSSSFVSDSIQPSFGFIGSPRAYCSRKGRGNGDGDDDDDEEEEEEEEEEKEEEEKKEAEEEEGGVRGAKRARLDGGGGHRVLEQPLSFGSDEFYSMMPAGDPYEYHSIKNTGGSGGGGDDDDDDDDDYDEEEVEEMEKEEEEEQEEEEAEEEGKEAEEEAEAEAGTTLPKLWESADIDFEGMFPPQYYPMPYYPVQFEEEVRLARDSEVGGLMGVRGVKRTRSDGGGDYRTLEQRWSYVPSYHGWGHENDGGDDDDEEEEEEEEEICLASVLVVDGLDCLPF